MRIGWKPKSSDPNVASVRFRCLSPIEALKELGVDANLFDSAQSYDIVIFSKLYGREDQRLARALKARGTRVALDLSDNHFYNPRRLSAYEQAARDLRAMIALVDRVICCSAALAEIVAFEARPRLPPLIVGDAVENIAGVARAPDDAVFRMLWFGSHGAPNAPSGMEDVLRIKSHIEEAAKKRVCELAIVSNNEAKYRALADEIAAPMRYVEWSEAAFAAELSHAHVALVPISPNPFTRAKSNNRPATTLWHGVPTLADAIPAYQDLAPFVVLDDWSEGFRAALNDAGEWRQRTENGRDHVRAHFNRRSIAMAWRGAIEACFENVQSRAGAA